MNFRKLYSTHRIATLSAAAALFLLLLIGISAYISLFGTHYRTEKDTYIYIDRNDTPDSVLAKISATGSASNLRTLRMLMKYRDYQVRTGRYEIANGENNFHLFRTLSAGRQAPLMLTVGSPRTVYQLAKSLGSQLMADSASIASLMDDTAYVASLGYTTETLPALFVPNSYEVYWDIAPKDLFARLRKEHDAFWKQKGRKETARAMGMTPEQVATLASIVDAETNYAPEKPRVAGLYLNRLHSGMKLQSDPTVIFAIGDFSIRRVGGKQLAHPSPYNTYKHNGLPPGPIRIAGIQGIDAVLQAEKHDYLYMCAKEDFSGSHRFASSWAEHSRNAALYQRALSKRNIELK